jgi:hypothetical protein
MTVSKNYILDQSLAEKKLRRMALEIIENNARGKGDHPCRHKRQGQCSG